jgi:diaminopimelate decarboxylase
MEFFSRRNGSLYAEDVALSELARAVGTPCYVYSLAALRTQLGAWREGFGDHPHLVCYSVKANSNLAVLRALANEGAGFDVVSGGELARVLAAGGQASSVVFSGVGKQAWEIRAALDAGILMFNVESPAELELINQLALEMGTTAPVSLRVNPDVDPQTHPYIATGLADSKFGVAADQCVEHYHRAAELKGIEVLGADCHLGSQLVSSSPIEEAATRMASLLDRLESAGIPIGYIDMGGGLGVTYQDESPPGPDEWAATLLRVFEGRGLTIVVEPGRSIAANAGVLLTTVLFHKGNHEKNFVVVDAGMNDLARPSLYSAHHDVEAVEDCDGTITADVVGPICESGDFFAKERLVANVQAGGLLAIMSAGAYGFVMASNYNTRPRPAEVLVNGDSWDLVRERETVESLFAGEAIPGHLSGE